MKTAIAIDKFFYKVEEVFITICIWVMAVILVANVIDRICFHRTLDFAEEITALLNIIVTFVGTSYCVRIGRHITMTALYDALKPKVQKVFTLVVCLVTCVMMFIIAWMAFGYVQELYSNGRVTTALLLPLWIPYTMVPIAFVFSGIQYGILFVDNIIHNDLNVRCLYPQEEEYAFSEDFEEDGGDEK